MKASIFIQKHSKVAGVNMLADIAEAANGPVEIHFDDSSYILAILKKTNQTNYSFKWRD